MVKQITKICEWCGKEFTVPYRKRDKKGCCKQCGIQIRIHSLNYLNSRGSKRKYDVNDYFLQQECPAKYYVLGLMAADGILTKDGYIKIWQADKEDLGLDLITWYKNTLNSQSPIKTCQYKKGRKQFGIQITSPILYEDFSKHYITPTKTFTVHVPKYILEDETKLRYYLIGYIDGDGYIGIYQKKNGYYTIELSFIGNDMFTSELLPYIKTNPMSIRINKSNPKVTSMGCGGTSAILFCEWLYKDFDESIFKSFKTKKVINYLNNLKTMVNPKTYEKYQYRKLCIYFDNNLIDETDLQKASKYFNIDLNRVIYVYNKWRNKNGRNKQF